MCSACLRSNAQCSTFGELEFQRPIRVLMLESHLPDVQVMKETLELAGLPADVTSVSFAEEVLYAAEDDTLDIALLNLQLPDVDVAIVDELRSLDGAKRLPIIAFSAECPEHADHVFPKPEHEAEYMGIVAAIRFYWMSAAPSLVPPPPPEPDSASSSDSRGQGSVRPQRRSGVDLMGLHIEPVEAYLLSMVDGAMDVDEISLSIGTEIKETRAMLRRLADLGVIAWRAPHPSMPPPGPPSIAPPSLGGTPMMDSGFRRPMRPISSSIAEEPTQADDTPDLDASPSPEMKAASEAPPKSANPAVFADAARKKSIDDAHSLLGEVDYYELLGVPRDADKVLIRKAYFELAKLFHTDSLYGVELAEYGPKMDKVFQAVTEAYEVLGKKKKRRAYDAYLGAVMETASLEPPRYTHPPARPSLIPKVLVIPLATPEEVHHSKAADSVAESSEQSKAANPESNKLEERGAEPADPESTKSAAPRAARPSAGSTQTRREIADKLFARRMGRHAMPPVQPPTQEPSKTSAEAAQPTPTPSAPKRRADRADRLIEDARIAEENGNVTGAAEALRIASAWRPHDLALAQDAERLRHAALVEKAPLFAKRARYAERNGNWEEAATCWSRVADVRTEDPAASSSAAAAIVAARGDMRKAAEYAKRSVELAPKDAQCHRVLGEVWIAARMPSSAKRCFETALQLCPEDEKAAALLAGLRG